MAALASWRAVAAVAVAVLVAAAPASPAPAESPTLHPSEAGGCASFLTRGTCLNPSAAKECHGGLLPCSCAWCASGVPDQGTCLDLDPCSNATSPRRCESRAIPDRAWSCASFKADLVSRKVNLVIVATAFWWPVGLLLGRALYHRMRLVMPARVASGFLWTFAGLGPFGVNALLAYRNESNLEVMASAFFWWYFLFLGAPLLVMFALGSWRILQRRSVHPAYKFVTAAVAVFAAWVVWLAFSPLPRATPSMAVAYRATLALVWMQLLQPLERLRAKGTAVPVAALGMLTVVWGALRESQHHRGYSAERTWLGVAAWVPSLAVAWHCWALVHTRRICGMRWRHQTPLAAFLLYFWLALTALCLLLLFVLHRRAAEVVTGIYIALLHAPVLVPLLLPLLDATPTAQSLRLGDGTAAPPAPTAAEARRRRSEAATRRIRDVETRLNSIEEELSAEGLLDAGDDDEDDDGNSIGDDYDMLSSEDEPDRAEGEGGARRRLLDPAAAAGDDEDDDEDNLDESEEVVFDPSSAAADVV